MDRAGLRYELTQDGPFWHATLAAASPEHPEAASFMIDAPGGWFRVATVVSPRPDSVVPPPHEALANYNTMGLHLGFGQVHWDGRIPGVRICVHGLASRGAPIGSFVRAAVDQCLRIRTGIQHGRGDPAYVHDPGIPDVPTLQDAVLALGDQLPFVWQVDGSFAAETTDSRGRSILVRVLEARPGVFGFQALAGQPREPVAMVPWLHTWNAGALSGGALVRLGTDERADVAYTWVCPFVWLDPETLREDVLLRTAQGAVDLVRYRGEAP